jgi:hypothetical protein
MLIAFNLNAVVFLGRSDGVFLSQLPRCHADQKIRERL